MTYATYHVPASLDHSKVIVGESRKRICWRLWGTAAPLTLRTDRANFAIPQTSTDRSGRQLPSRAQAESIRRHQRSYWSVSNLSHRFAICPPSGTSLRIAYPTSFPLSGPRPPRKRRAARKCKSISYLTRCQSIGLALPLP